jgi:hypothetical protein
MDTFEFVGHSAAASARAVRAARSVDWASLPRLLQAIGADALPVTTAQTCWSASSSASSASRSSGDSVPMPTPIVAEAPGRGHSVTVGARGAAQDPAAASAPVPQDAQERCRRDQARTVAANAESWAGPVVIAGDFNGTAGARELSDLGFTWPTREVHNTLGRLDLDHILACTAGCATGRPAASKAPDLTDASDHAPVWATVQPCTVSD